MNADQELKLAAESGRGAKARSILTDDMFVEAMEVIEKDILDKWKSAPIRDTEGQLALRLKWQCLSELKKHLIDVMTTGKLAEAQLRYERTLAERAKAAMKAFVR